MTVSEKPKGALRWYLLLALSRDSREQYAAAKPSASQGKAACASGELCGGDGRVVRRVECGCDGLALRMVLVGGCLQRGGVCYQHRRGPSASDAAGVKESTYRTASSFPPHLYLSTTLQQGCRPARSPLKLPAAQEEGVRGPEGSSVRSKCAPKGSTSSAEHTGAAENRCRGCNYPPDALPAAMSGLRLWCC